MQPKTVLLCLPLSPIRLRTHVLRRCLQNRIQIIEAISIKVIRSLLTLWTVLFLRFARLAFSSTRFSVDTVASEKQPAVYVAVIVNSLTLKIGLDTGLTKSVVGSSV